MRRSPSTTGSVYYPFSTLAVVMSTFTGHIVINISSIISKTMGKAEGFIFVAPLTLMIFGEWL